MVAADGRKGERVEIGERGAGAVRKKGRPFLAAPSLIGGIKIVYFDSI